MALSFTRKVNMSPGQRDTGDVIDAGDVNDLQEALEDISLGTVPIPLAGISGALGAYEPLAHMRAGVANVLDYEFVGDGATDNSTNLASMLSGTQQGTEYYLPPGDYLVGQIALSDLRHFHLHLDAKLITKSGVNAAGLLFNAGSDGSSVRGGTLDHNKDGQSGGSGIHVMADDISIDSVSVQNAKEAGIRAQGANRTRIQHNRILNHSTSAVFLQPAGADIADAFIFANYIQTDVDNANGIRVRGDDTTYRCVGAHIGGNTIRLNGLNGLCIEAWGGAPYSTVWGNATFGGNSGISMADAGNSAIGNNTIYGPESIGIEVAGGSSYCGVTGNTIDGAGVLAGGIGISDASSFGSLVGNTIKDTTNRAISIYQSTGFVVGQNVIDIAAGNGIHLQEQKTAQVVIVGNLLRGRAGSSVGVYALEADGWIAQGNIFDGWNGTLSAIRIFGDSTFTFEDILATPNVYLNTAAAWTENLSGGAVVDSGSVSHD